MLDGFIDTLCACLMVGYYCLVIVIIWGLSFYIFGDNNLCDFFLSCFFALFGSVFIAPQALLVFVVNNEWKTEVLDADLLED